MWPALSGKVTKPEPRTIYIPLPKSWAVLRDGWKLIVFDRGTPGRDDSDELQLYNVDRDPSETQDLASSEPQRLAEMKALLAELRKGDNDVLPADLRNVKD